VYRAAPGSFMHLGEQPLGDACPELGRRVWGCGTVENIHVFYSPANPAPPTLRRRGGGHGKRGTADVVGSCLRRRSAGTGFSRGNDTPAQARRPISSTAVRSNTWSSRTARAAGLL